MTITIPPETRSGRARSGETEARPARSRPAPEGAGRRTGSTTEVGDDAGRERRSARGRTATGPDRFGRTEPDRPARKIAPDRPARESAPSNPARPPARKPAAAGTTAGRTAVRTRQAVAPPRAPFVLLVVGLLGGALVSLLLLNTVLAQDAFTLSELQRGNQQLSERHQALQEDISREESPAVLYQKARELGMVDPGRPAFIDARTGRVTEGGARPPGVSDEAMAAAAAGGMTGVPGVVVPPAGGVAPPASATSRPPAVRPHDTGGGTR